MLMIYVGQEGLFDDFLHFVGQIFFRLVKMIILRIMKDKFCEGYILEFRQINIFYVCCLFKLPFTFLVIVSIKG